MISGFSPVQLTEEERAKCVESLTEQLPALRIKLGVSQDELASLIGLARQTYCTLETKKRKMTWSVFLSLIFIFDNSAKTHDIIRSSGLFPEAVFGENIYRKDLLSVPASEFISEELRKQLDETAVHAIETMIMIEYARCNNIPGENVVRAFNGKKFTKVSSKDVKVKSSLKRMRKSK